MSLRKQISQELSALVEKKRKSGYAKRRKSGLIDSHRLAFHKTTSDVFKKKNRVEDGLELAVTVLVDASGSMNGAKMEMVKKVLPELYHGITDVHGTVVSVISFSSTIRNLVSFGEQPNWQEAKSVLNNECNGYNKYKIVRDNAENNVYMQPVDNGGSYDAGSGHNYDIAGLGKALQQFDCINAASKLLIVLSDGQAGGSELTGGHRGLDNKRPRKILGSTLIPKADDVAYNINQEEGMKYMLSLAEKAGIKVASIGIMSDAVKRYYKFPHVCMDISKFGRVFRDVLINIYQK